MSASFARCGRGSIAPITGSWTWGLKQAPWWVIISPMAKNNPPDMKIRLSSALRRQIEDAARANNRTLNSEVVSRLERTFREDAQNAGTGMTWIAKAKKGSATQIEKRLAALETAMLAIVADDRTKKLEERIAALESLVGRPTS